MARLYFPTVMGSCGNNTNWQGIPIQMTQLAGVKRKDIALDNAKKYAGNIGADRIEIEAQQEFDNGATRIEIFEFELRDVNGDAPTKRNDWGDLKWHCINR